MVNGNFDKNNGTTVVSPTNEPRLPLTKDQEDQLLMSISLTDHFNDQRIRFYSEEGMGKEPKRKNTRLINALRVSAVNNVYELSLHVVKNEGPAFQYYKPLHMVSAVGPKGVARIYLYLSSREDLKGTEFMRHFGRFIEDHNISLDETEEG